jgi:hypothetical protein
VLALPAAACLLPRIGRPLLALLKLLLLLRALAVAGEAEAMLTAR